MSSDRKLYHKVNFGRGPYFIDSIMPSHGKFFKFRQLYVYDNGNEVPNMINAIHSIRNEIDPNIVQKLVNT